MFQSSYVILEISGEHKIRFINLCAHHEIKIWNVSENENKLRLSMSSPCFFEIKKLLKKTNIKVKIVEKKGMYYLFRKMLQQKFFYLFLILCLFLLIFSSNFLWKIDITGNKEISHELVEDFLNEQNVRYGMPLGGINTEMLEKEMRKDFFLITWISVSLQGTTLKIEIKENDTITMQPEERVVKQNIIASADGIVENILVRAGTAKVKKGDTVKKGDVLIEGLVSILAEDGSIKTNKLMEAKGDVAIVYSLPVQEKIFLEYDTKVFSGEEYTSYLFKINDYIIERKGKKSPFLRYDLLEEEITPDFFRKFFPDFKIYKESFLEYLPYKEKYSTSEAEKILKENFNKFLKSLEEKGVQIIEKNVKIKANDVSVSLEGTVTLKEVCKEKSEINE